jgi:hypothetical protein
VSTEHAPYVYTHHGLRLGTQYRAECACGWAGVTWFSRRNADGDVERHRARHQEVRAAAEAQRGES